MVEDFVLYILMRNDMESLNPGKAVAQGSHAANVFTYRIKCNSPFYKEYQKWLGGRGYGTVNTLEGSENDIRDVVNDACNDGYTESAHIIDETYPLKDGKTTHYFPCYTCSYVFAPRGYYRNHPHVKRMK